MLFLLSLASLIVLSNCLAITHDYGSDDSIHGKATSYQNIHMEHFHPVPTYIKKEDKHLLEHPISLGSSSSKVEIHHGGKHDHGYATASVKNDVHGLESFGDFGGGEHEFSGHEDGYAAGLSGGEEANLGGHEANYESSDAGLAGHEGSLGGHEAILATQGGHESIAEGNGYGAGGHGIASAGYEVHDQGNDYTQFQGPLAAYQNYGNEEH